MAIFGYIDPGTGSLFLQAIIGVLLGGIVVFRNVIGRAIYKLRAMLFRQNANDEEQE